MAYKLDKDLEKYFTSFKRKREFHFPRICYRCWVKYPNKKDKVYIQMVGYEDDSWTEEVEKKKASIWQNFDELKEAVECYFYDDIEDGTLEYVKIELCVRCVEPWWKRWDKNWFEHMKSIINHMLGFRMNEYKSTKSWSIKEFGKWKTFWMNPLWDLILPHRWIKNWIGRILYIKEKSVFRKED